MKKSAAILVSDCLSEVTRKERRSLLGISMLGIVITQAELVPTKISALGVEFSQANQAVLLLILAFVVGYYLLAFIIYRLADFSVWRLRFGEIAVKDTEELKHSLINESKEHSEPEPEADPDEKVHLSNAESSSIKNRFSSISKSGKRWVAVAPTISVARAAFDFLLPIVLAVYAIWSLALSS